MQGCLRVNILTRNCGRNTAALNKSTHEHAFALHGLPQFRLSREWRCESDMLEVIWCFVISWLLLGAVYVLGLLVDKLIDFVIYTFRNNGE